MGASFVPSSFSGEGLSEVSEVGLQEGVKSFYINVLWAFLIVRSFVAGIIMPVEGGIRAVDA